MFTEIAAVSSSSSGRCLAFGILVASASLAGCAASSEPTDADETPAGAKAGLELATSTPDHAAGTFERDGKTLGFDLSRDGDVVHATLTIGALSPAAPRLLEATLHEGIDRASLLGGRLVVEGDTRTLEPRMEGDLTALDDLVKLPEVALVTPLKEALAAANVEASLFRAASAGKGGGLSPQGVLANCIIDEQMWVRVPTWSFWGVTTINLINPRGTEIVPVSVTTYNGRKDTYPVWARWTVTGQWWGAPVTVKNESYWVGWTVRVDAY